MFFFGFQRGWHHPWTSHRQVRKEVEEMTRLGYHGKMLMAMFQNRIDATWFTMIQDPYFFYKIHIVLQEASRCFSNGSFWSSDLHSWNTSILELFPNVHSRMAYSQIHTRISTWKRWWTLCNKARLKELKEMSKVDMEILVLDKAGDVSHWLVVGGRVVFWLVVWNINFMTFHSSPSFFGGVGSTTNQIIFNHH